MLATDILALATDLWAVWSAPTTDARLKKRVVRTVIQKVIADIDDEASEIVLLIHWICGAHTGLRLPKQYASYSAACAASVASRRIYAL